MGKLQILVPTMHQDNIDLVDRMNIKCDTVITNQADRNEITYHVRGNATIKMITTDTRGVGLNRNIGLLASTAEILLFSDDDMRYYDDAESVVLDAFRRYEAADVIIFGVNLTRGGSVVSGNSVKDGKRHLWNSLRYGTSAVAVKRESVLKHNITFHQCFGGGCIYGSGEDSLFIKACFDHGLKVYGSSSVLGETSTDSSTWFTGYNEKYFYDKGALMNYLFPVMKYPMAGYFSLNFKHPDETTIGFLRRLDLYMKGIRGGKKLIPYSEYIRR